MDSFMPWVVGLFVLLIVVVFALVTKAKKNRNRPGADEP
jgi:hypothetical protein